MSNVNWNILNELLSVDDVSEFYNLIFRIFDDSKT